MKRILGVILVLAFLVACAPLAPKPNKEELAVSTSEHLARLIEQQQWGMLYDYAIPELQQMANKSTFILNARVAFLVDETFPNVVRLDRVSVVNENEAYAYFTAYYPLNEVKLPAFQLIWDDEKQWQYIAYLDLFRYDRIYEIQIAEIQNPVLEIVSEELKTINDAIIDMTANMQIRGFSKSLRNYVNCLDVNNKIQQVTEVNQKVSVIRQKNIEKLRPEYVEFLDCSINAFQTFHDFLNIENLICLRSGYSVDSYEMQKLQDLGRILGAYVPCEP